MDDESNVWLVTPDLNAVVALLVTGNDVFRDSLLYKSPTVIPLPNNHSALKSLALLHNLAFQIVQFMFW
jgi:hypothetical protein